jgi:predicted XRE-type DNA-binding protein
VHHELRIRDENRIWRVVYRLDPDAIVVVAVFPKTTRSTSKHDIAGCKARWKAYDTLAREKESGVSPMDKRKRKALEAAGWVFEDAEDFLELTPEERCLVELRVAISRDIRARREQQHMTQLQLAKKLKTSQPRVAKIEAASADVSLDLMFRSLFALGGTLRDLRISQ